MPMRFVNCSARSDWLSLLPAQAVDATQRSAVFSPWDPILAADNLKSIDSKEMQLGATTGPPVRSFWRFCFQIDRFESGLTPPSLLGKLSATQKRSVPIMRSMRIALSCAATYHL